MNSIQKHFVTWYRGAGVFTAITLSVLLQNSYAVPASPTIHTLTQSKGLTFKAQQWGDEWSNGWETTTGYTILWDKNNGIWKYATAQLDGHLTISKFRVGIDTLPENFPQKLRPKIPTTLQKNVPLTTVLAIETAVSTLGTANVPVILINFTDRTTTYTPSAFESLLFGIGNKSMKDYYEEVSYGEFSVSSGPAGVVGWYQALHGHNYYGYNQGFERARELAEEAVAAADTTVNFANYDNDGDCYVDTVMIIHQGTGTEASGDYNDIWSHAWNIPTYTTNDNASCGAIKISSYTTEPEILQSSIHTVGVFTHEYGHVLGLPDLYDTDGSSEGIGNWDLMAGGSWNKVSKIGDTPAHLSAWGKYALGWVVPYLVTAELPNKSIEQVATQADVYQFLTGSPSTGGEYFLVENRNRTGFDAGLPTSGLVIWHIDESKATLDNTDNANECTSPDNPPGNCNLKHYRVALIQADNRWDLEKGNNRGDSGDLYSASAGYTTFNDSSSPSSKLYNGSSSKVCVTGISNSGSVMTATLNNNCSSSPPPTGSSCMGLQCTIVGTANNDVIYGTTGQDIICGGGGNDRIYGNKGNDIICGGDGNDIIYGQAGDDIIFGEGGSDRCIGGRPGTDQIDCEIALP